MVAFVLLLLMLVLALADSLVRKDLRRSRLFAVPIVLLVGMYVWFFTLLPVRWELKVMPFVERAQIKSMSAQGDTALQRGYVECEGVMELVTDRRLDAGEVVLKGSKVGHVSWNDFAGADSLAVLTSYEVAFIKEVEGKFFYQASFLTRQPLAGEVGDSIYCKVFMVRMFAPVYETNEFAVQFDDAVR